MSEAGQVQSLFSSSSTQPKARGDGWQGTSVAGTTPGAGGEGLKRFAPPARVGRGAGELDGSGDDDKGDGQARRGTVRDTRRHTDTPLMLTT